MRPQGLLTYRACFHLGVREARRAKSCVRSHASVVGEGIVTHGARLACSAAAMVQLLELFLAVPELRRWFVSCARCASVWPRLRRAVVAHPAAVRVLPQLAALERFLAPAASPKDILLLYMAGLADGGVCREVRLLALLPASRAWLGGAGRRLLNTDGTHPQRAQADAHVVQVCGVVPIHIESVGGEHEGALSTAICRAEFVSLGAPCLVLRHHRSVFVQGVGGAVRGILGGASKSMSQEFQEAVRSRQATHLKQVRAKMRAATRARSRISHETE